MEKLYFELGELLSAYKKNKIKINELTAKLKVLFDGDWDKCFDAGVRFIEGGKMPRNDLYAREIIYICIENENKKAAAFAKQNPEFMQGKRVIALPAINYIGTILTIIGVLLCISGAVLCFFKLYVISILPFLLAVILCSGANWDFMKNGCENNAQTFMMLISAIISLPTFFLFIILKIKVFDNNSPAVVCREDGEVLHEIKPIRIDFADETNFLVIEEDFVEKKIKLAELNKKKGRAKDYYGNVYKNLKNIIK